MNLQNCPDEFYNNCANQIRKCRVCAAGCGKPSGKVLYVPIEESEPHPYKYVAPRKPPKDKVRSHIVKSAKHHEQKATQRLAKNVARRTLASGAIEGNGDAVHSIPDVMELRVEQKLRPAGATFSVSTAEYQKGLRQNIHVWEITVPDKGTVYILREDIYTELLALARINSDGKTTSVS